MLHRPILNIVADSSGHIRTEFVDTTPAAWADDHMNRRYSQSRMTDDKPSDFPYLCWESLCQEYLTIRSWFDNSGKLNPLVHAASLQPKISGQLGNGISWDWKANGDPDVRMFMFKGPLIAAWRTAQLIPPSDRNSGNMQMGGLATIIRGAYTERAKVHRWVGYAREAVTLPGDVMSRRWVAHMTNNFLVSLGADRRWAWEVSKCKSILGPVEEEGSYL